jgi:hypothetical protein
MEFFGVELVGFSELKDAMTRDILRGLAGAGIRIASTTIEIVGR